MSSIPLDVEKLTFKPFAAINTKEKPPMTTPAQVPSVGRIVHYQSYGTPGGELPSAPRAAVITAVNENGTVDVCVLNPSGLYFNQGLSMGGPEGTTPVPGCWNWPPRQ